MNENKLIKPARLKPGDTIGIISPAGSVKEGSSWEETIRYFENRGYKVKIAPHAKDRNEYLAGFDQDRLSDLISFFKDDEISAIICSRGGYGVFRLLSGIDWNVIRENPKIFVGYSDITALLNNIVNKSGLVAFHGPLALSDFGVNDVNKYTEKTFFEVLEGRISIPYAYKNPIEYECINSGKTEGILAGGNLAILTGLLGTPYFPNLKNKILLLEDIGEPLYKIDRMLMQLKLAGVFNQVSGILFGEFTCIPESDNPEISKLSVIEIIKELTQDLSIPVGFGFPAGHGGFKATIPLGVKYFFDAETGKLTLLDECIN